MRSITFHRSLRSHADSPHALTELCSELLRSRLNIAHLEAIHVVDESLPSLRVMRLMRVPRSRK